MSARNWLLAGLLAWAALPASAQGAAEDLTTLMRSSGIDRQLQTLVPGFRQALEENQQQLFVPRQITARLLQLAAKEFDDRKLGLAIRRHLAASLTPAEIAIALEWYSSPLGGRIVELEVRASDPREMLRMRNARDLVEERLSAERHRQLAELDRALKGSETVAMIVVGIRMAMVEGILLALPAEHRASLEKWRREAEPKPGELLAAARQDVLLLLAYTYRSLEDAELDAYLHFAHSHAGNKLHLAFFEALESALLDASRRFGSEMARLTAERPLPW